MDDGRLRFALGACGGGVELESVVAGLGRRDRVVVLRLSRCEDRGIIEDVPPFSCGDELDECARARRARGVRAMARSPEWNKLEYSTPVAQSFAFSQDI